jgi:hypothetical protein
LTAVATAIPQSGMPGVRWSPPHRKWKVILRVRGKDHYYGLFDDLEEAKSVCARARLDHDYDAPRSDREPDTTSHLSDAEVIERFYLDKDGDPAWRERPLVGDDATVRDRFRWNKRHAGAKFPERGGFERDGKVKLMYRLDVAKRLAAIRDAAADGLVSTLETSDPVAPGCLHASGIPDDENTTTKSPEPGDYEAALEEALKIEDRIEREKAAKVLEGEIIPPAPIGKGPLALVLIETKREFGLREDEVIVLSSGKDPYGQDTPRGHRLSRWFKVRLDLHAPSRKIHLRGVHYLLVAVQAVKSDGTSYENTREDYFWLNDYCAKAARWLRYIPFDRIVDERNEEAIIFRAERRESRPLGFSYAATGYRAPEVVRPPSIEIMRATPGATLTLHVEQNYCFAVFGEKSSLAEVLVPFCRRHGADCFIAIGELSETRAWEMAEAAVADGRKLICLTFCDFDPSGFQMPVSIAIKLMGQRDLQFPEFEFAVVPVALTLAQVIENRLPTAMVEKKDKRLGMWQATFAPPLIEAGLLPQEQVEGGGLAQVEIDALAAIHPEVLDGYAEAAIAPYLDATLAGQIAETKAAWEREANAALAAGVDRAKLDTLSSIERLVAESFNSRIARPFNRLERLALRAKGHLDAIEAAIQAEVDRVQLPPLPETPEAEDSSETATPLIDSDWSHIEMIEALKGRKKYEDEG